jgi:hypothetical protein
VPDATDDSVVVAEGVATDAHVHCRKVPSGFSVCKDTLASDDTANARFPGAELPPTLTV